MDSRASHRAKGNGANILFFLYCTRNKWLTTNPCNGLQSISVPPPKAEYFTEEEYERIVDAISCYGLELTRKDQRKVARARLSAMVELLRWTGLRISDAACLPRKDLLQEHGRWLIRTEIMKKSGKTKRTVSVRLKGKTGGRGYRSSLP